MNRQLTNLEGLLALALLALGVALTLACTGCQTTDPCEERYHIEAFDVVVANPEVIRDLYNAYPVKMGHNALGFCDMEKRLIYVPHSVRGEGLAVDWILGHELQHLPEWGGHWHDENGKVIPREQRP